MSEAHTGCGAYCDSANDMPCQCCRYSAEVERITAAIQRVRDWLDSEGFPVDTESPYGQGYHHAMNDARRALDGEA